MARDNTIKVYRSTGSTPPSSFLSDATNGPTFGELAFVDGLTSLYMGRADGSVVWIGAQVTGGNVSQGLEYAVPTMKAVKDYVTANSNAGYFIVKGEDGLTHQIDLAGTLTLTGGNGIDVVKSATEDTFIFRAVTGSSTEWGVLKVNSSGPLFVDTNGLNVQTNAKLFTVQDEKGTTEEIGYDQTLTLTGGRGIDVLRTGTDTFAVEGVTATVSTLGVASFSGTNFTVSNGQVSSKGIQVYGSNQTNGTLTAGNEFTITGDALGVISVVVDPTYPGSGLGFGGGPKITITPQRAGYSSTFGVAAFEPSSFTVASGVVSLTSGPIFYVRDEKQSTSLNIAFGDTLTITGGPGINVFVDGGTDRIAVQGVTATHNTLGVASFPATYFDVTSGVVTLTGAYQVTGDTVTGPNASLVVSKTGRTATLDNRMGSYTLTGVASFDPRFFGIGASGHLTLTGPYQVTGSTVLGTGAITVSTTNNTSTVDARLAVIDGATGVASFSSSYFSISSGVVSLISAYQVTGDTVDGPNASLKITRSGRTVTLDNRLASTSLTGVASFDSTYFSVGTSVAGQVKIIMVDGGTFT